MMISSPAPVGATPPPAAPVVGTKPVNPTPPAGPVGAPSQAAPIGNKPVNPAPGSGQSAPVDAAAAKAQVLDKLMKTSAAEAIAEVDSHLAKISSLTVGGGTPEGTQGAKAASALLTDASMLLQHAHVKAMESLRTMAADLHLKLMSSSSGLAYMGGQIALAGQSKQQVKIAEIAAGPIADTKATMAEVVAALGGAAPAAPAAPNGNGGVAGPYKPGVHLTPGPGVGPGPHPA